ncbi:MAG TPA: hypothetical protein DCP51_03550 [Clostridiales bacterium]|nr:hypothetical protein [Clostridiales bacterium]
MFWFIVLVLYICLICSLANRQKENFLFEARKSDIQKSVLLPDVFYKNKEGSSNILPPSTEDNPKKTIMKTKVKSSNSWLFELGL